MTARYVPPDKLADYLEYERTQLGEHIAVYMRITGPSAPEPVE